MQPEFSGESPPEENARPSATVLIDILIAPGRAFRTIAARRPWLLATLLVIACVALSFALQLPAQLHVEKIGRLALGATVELASLQIFVDAILLVYSWSIIASVFANMIASGKPEYWTTYRTFFALAANAAIPSALGALALGIAVHLHPPESFRTMAQLANAIPFSLALFASPNNEREATFLSNFDLTTVWSILLVAYGAHAIGRIRMTWALIVPCGVTLALAVIFLIPSFFH